MCAWDVSFLCLGILLIHFLFGNGNANDLKDFQKSLPVRNEWAVLGMKAKLPCNLTAPTKGDSINMVLWFKDAQGVPLYSFDARGGTLEDANHWAIDNDLGARTFFQASPTFSILHITNIVSADEGVYRCRIDFKNSPTRNYKVNLTIVAPPETPVIYDIQGKEVATVVGPVTEGYDLQLTCKVSGGRPKPEVTWWQGTNRLDATWEQRPDGVTLNYLFLPKVPREFRSAHLACHAQNSVLVPPVVREVMIDMYLRPLQVRITTRDQALTAGKTHMFRCETSGSYPIAQLSWWKDGEKMRFGETTVDEGENTTTSSLTFQPNAEDEGKILTCRAENPWIPGGILEDRIRLDVSYAPIVGLRGGTGSDLENIKEGDNVYLQCTVRANPAATTITWYHQGYPLDLNASQIVLGERSIFIRGIEVENAGAYICEAGNSEGLSKSKELNIRIQYSPRCKADKAASFIGAVKHEKVEIKCEVDADPPDVRFRWTYNNSRDVFYVPSYRVNSNGLVSMLNYSPAADKDFGTLACWASNEIGQQQSPCTFNVVPARIPKPPFDCTARNRSLNSIGVDCQASFDGGLQQHFVLEVTESGSSTSPPVYKMLSGGEPSFQLHNLEVGKSYDVVIYAVNAKGRSDGVVLSGVRVTTMEKLTDGTDPALLSALLLYAVCGGAAVLVVSVLAAAGFVLCRRRQVEKEFDKVSQEEQEDPTQISMDEMTGGGRPRSRDVGTLTNDDDHLQNRSNPSQQKRVSNLVPSSQRNSSNVKNEPDILISRAEVILKVKTET